MKVSIKVKHLRKGASFTCEADGYRESASSMIRLLSRVEKHIGDNHRGQQIDLQFED